MQKIVAKKQAVPSQKEINFIMKKSFFLIIAILMLTMSSCKKCYECTLKCATCTKDSQPTLSACNGDSILNGQSIDEWRKTLVEQDYNCVFNNSSAQEACSASAKKTYESQSYTCVSN